MNYSNEDLRGMIARQDRIYNKVPRLSPRLQYLLLVGFLIGALSAVMNINFGGAQEIKPVSKVDVLYTSSIEIVSEFGVSENELVEFKLKEQFSDLWIGSLAGPGYADSVESYFFEKSLSREDLRYWSDYYEVRYFGNVIKNVSVEYMSDSEGYIVYLENGFENGNVYPVWLNVRLNEEGKIYYIQDLVHTQKRMEYK